MNTKFCYYNNYSLSQPRYFCKACRRYWTQGGTLRNVPVRGGCRKMKRAKGGSSSASASRTVQPQPSQKEQDMQNTLGIGGDSVGMSTENPSGGLAVHHQYYPGASHGYLSSLAGLQSLNQSQPFNVGGGHDPASNMSLLQGFNLPAPAWNGQMVQSQPQQQRSERRCAAISGSLLFFTTVSSPLLPISSKQQRRRQSLRHQGCTALLLPPPPSLASQLPAISKTAVKRLAGREALPQAPAQVHPLRCLQNPLPITQIYTKKKNMKKKKKKKKKRG
ncbi:hypothetical protein ACFX1Z_037476 [Malus domestica]